MSPARFFHVDAFTTRTFGGAAAPIFVSNREFDDLTARTLTREFQQPVAAFLMPEADRCRVRFFTEKGEVGYVGHAGLAAAFVYLRLLRVDRGEGLLESPVGGVLPVAQAEDGAVTIDFAAMSTRSADGAADIGDALGGVRVQALHIADFGMVALVEDEETVLALAPDMEKVARAPGNALIVTAPGRRADFVSRVFAPKLGLPEDPVCGTAHRILAPYWAERLGRTQLHADQLSARGGTFLCEVSHGRVRLTGHCVCLIEGYLAL